MTLPKIKRKKVGDKSIKVRVVIYLCVLSSCFFTLLFLHGKSIASIELASSSTSSDSVAIDKKQELRGSNNGQANIPPLSSLPKTITLNTPEGNIKIKLRPDLSLPSVQYIKKLLDDPSPCQNCRFYRAEKPGILQGILAKKNVKKNTVLGDCPEEFKGKKHDCPQHDPNCGCHGPVMRKGMIGW